MLQTAECRKAEIPAHREQHFMSLLELVRQTLTVLLPQAGDELLGRDDADFLLLRGDGVEEVGQACEQVLLLLLLGFVGQHVLSKRPAEVERLEHGVTVTCVSKLRKEEEERAFSLITSTCVLLFVFPRLTDAASRQVLRNLCFM